MKYFIDNNTYYQGKKQAPKKVYLPIVSDNGDGTVIAIDEDGDDYTLYANQILDDEVKE